VFNLNPKIRFGDGTTLAPEDVAFSLLRLKYLEGPVAWFADNVASVDVTGPHQVTMKLSTIDVGVLYWLTSPFVSIGQASSMQAHGATDAATASTTDTARTWLNNNSVGSGPFILDDWVVGSTISMHRNPYYWGTKPPFAHIVFELTADASTQLDMLERGDAHIALNLTPQLAKSAASNPNIEVVTVPSEGFPWLGMNVKNNPALGIAKNWEAVKYAIDYQGLAQIYQNGGRPIASCIPQGMAHALPLSDSTVIKAKNVAKATAALEAAGNPNGFSFVMSYATDQYYSSVLSDVVAQAVAADLKAVGINATLNPLPAAEESTAFRAGTLEASIHVWGADYLGWTDFLPNFCPGGNVASNRQGWDPTFSAVAQQIASLTSEATQTVDASKQQSLCIQAQQLMNQNSPMAWLFEMASLIAYRKDVIKSLNTNPVSYIEVDSVVLQ
jgi:peptide/nickel transport system substrate-binding protein